MYFVRYASLKQQLRERSLTQRQALPYLIGTGIVIGLNNVLSLYCDSNSYDILSGFAMIVVFIIGTCYVYSENGGPSGFDFIRKYITLGWVVGCRFMLVWIVFASVVLTLIFIFDDDSSAEATIYTVWLDSFIGIIYYHRLGRHIRDTAEEV